MSDHTPTHRDTVLRVATEEGCPAEVTKEAFVLIELEQGEPLTERDREIATWATAYAYSAGRVARWDALVKGSPRLMDAILASVHEFFHEEPWPGHHGVALECPDCPTVAALAADAAAAYYSGLETADIMADPAAMADIAEAERELEEDVPFHVVKADIPTTPIDSLLHSGAAYPEEDDVEIIHLPEEDDQDPTNPAFWQQTGRGDAPTQHLATLTGALAPDKFSDDITFRAA